MMPEITPTDATLGAVVSNVRLNALDDEAFAAIEEAWHDHAVLIFPVSTSRRRSRSISAAASARWSAA